MKTPIFRKPKSMRNDEVMATYIDIAIDTSKKMSDPNLTLDQRYELARTVMYCVDEAGKSGGFFSKKDFIKWLKRQTHENSNEGS